MRRWASALLPVALYGALIVFLSAQSDLSGAPKIWDKAAHFGEYAILGFLVARAVRRIKGWPPGRSAVAAVILATAFAATDEVHQYFVPGRDADALDLFADFLGSIAGGGAYVAWLWASARTFGLPGRS